MQITQKQSCQDLQNLILNHKSLKMTQVLLQTLQNPRKMKQKQKLAKVCKLKII